MAGSGTGWMAAFAQNARKGEALARTVHFDGEGVLDASVFERGDGYTIAPVGVETSGWRRGIAEELEVSRHLREMGFDPDSGWQ